MTDLEDLIARLECAKAGSRELSDEVLLACGWTITKDRGPQAMYISPANTGPVHQVYAPSPTEDLNAALALVPEGWGWILSRYADIQLWLSGFTAVLEKPTGDGEWEPLGFIAMPAVMAATPALALCAAILRARAKAE